MTDLSIYDNDPTLYLFTSLTAGSSHIVTATSRIETILKANKIPFKGVDTATDDLARKLYGRRGGGRKLPLLVKEGYVLGDLEQIEEWNEYDELKEALGVTSAPAAAPTKLTSTSATAAASSTETPKENAPAANSEQNLAIRQLGAEAAKVAASKKPTPGNISTTNPLLAEKVNSPAATTPTKKADTSGILSPRSIPLPATPSNIPSSSTTEEAADAEKPNIPKLTSKPVHQPPSMHTDAADPALGAAPISTTVRSPSSSIASPTPLSPGSGSEGSGVKEFHGSMVGIASDEEIRQIEEEQTIPEVESEDEDSEEEEEEDIKSKETDKKDAAKTQEQSAKAEEKAGESVKD